MPRTVRGKFIALEKLVSYLRSMRYFSMLIELSFDKRVIHNLIENISLNVKLENFKAFDFGTNELITRTFLRQ